MKIGTNNIRILFIDDDNLWLNFAIKTLHRVGFYVGKAEIVESGLELIKEGYFELVGRFED